MVDAEVAADLAEVEPCVVDGHITEHDRAVLQVCACHAAGPLQAFFKLQVHDVVLVAVDLAMTRGFK